MAHPVLIVDDTEINLILFGALLKKLENCESKTFISSTDRKFNRMKASMAWALGHPAPLVCAD